MNGNIQSQLNALLESNFWKHSELTGWADEQIADLDWPETWVMNLSVSANSKEAIDVIRSAMYDSGTQVPANYGEVLIGLSVLKFEQGDSGYEEAEKEVFEVADAYEITSNVTDELGRVDLNIESISLCKELATKAIQYVDAGNYVESDMRLLGDRESD